MTTRPYESTGQANAKNMRKIVTLDLAFKAEDAIYGTAYYLTRSCNQMQPSPANTSCPSFKPKLKPEASPTTSSNNCSSSKQTPHF